MKSPKSCGQCAIARALTRTSLRAARFARHRLCAQVVAVGLEQQYGLPTGTAAVGFCVASDLDATADFDALCQEDADSGVLLLRSHVDVRWVFLLCWLACMQGNALQGVPEQPQQWAAQSSWQLNLQPHRTCRGLLSMLEDPLADLCLEYHGPTVGACGATHAAPTQQGSLLIARTC